MKTTKTFQGQSFSLVTTCRGHKIYRRPSKGLVGHPGPKYLYLVNLAKTELMQGFFHSLKAAITYSQNVKC